MAVYFAQMGATGPVKIGHSASPIARVAELSRPFWEDLRMIRCLEGMLREERMMHRRFDHLWLRGEWFSFDPEMLGDLGLPDVVVPIRGLDIPQAFAPFGIALRNWILARGMTIETAAESIGVKPRTLYHWILYSTRPRSKETCERLIEAAGPAIREHIPSFENGPRIRSRIAA